MRSLPLALLVLAACSHTMRDQELLDQPMPISYVGADFTRASIHDPLFDPGTFTAARVQGWSAIVTRAVHTQLPGLTIATETCDARNAAFVSTAAIYDPRPWQPPDLEDAGVAKRVAPHVTPRGRGLGLLVSLERVNAEDRLSALVILFERTTGRIALAERVRATLSTRDPFADNLATAETSLIGTEYQPHFEALGREVVRVLRAALES